MEQDTLERPAVADQPETAVATLPPETRAVLALNSSKTELDLRALATKHVTIVEIKDRAGREQAHGAAMELMKANVVGHLFFPRDLPAGRSELLAAAVIELAAERNFAAVTDQVRNQRFDRRVIEDERRR